MIYPVALQTHNFSAPASPEPQTPLPENEPKVIKITNCRILRQGHIVENDAIWIQAGKIIDPHKFFWYQKRLPDQVLDAGGLLVSSGFIETQINGAFGVDFSVPSDHETYEKDLLKVNRGLLKYGTTSYCPTIVSSSASVYHKVLPHLKPRAGSAQTGATILGAHVEGPFINEARIGAHELKVLQASAKNGYNDFKAVYGFEGETPEAQMLLSEEDLNSVKIITCAPELEGVMSSIPDLVKAGITVSVGHSMANISQAEEAVTQGATFITHLFNAMPQFHHRDPGVIGLLGSRLDLPRPYYGLICDGIHVHPNSVKIAYDSHPEGVILVTDAMSAMGLAPGHYQLGNMKVTKEEDRVYIEGTDTLAGRHPIDTDFVSEQEMGLGITPDASGFRPLKSSSKELPLRRFLPTPPISAPSSPWEHASERVTDVHETFHTTHIFAILETTYFTLDADNGWTEDEQDEDEDDDEGDETFYGDDSERPLDLLTELDDDQIPSQDSAIVLAHEETKVGQMYQSKHLNSHQLSKIHESLEAKLMEENVIQQGKRKPEEFRGKREMSECSCSGGYHGPGAVEVEEAALDGASDRSTSTHSSPSMSTSTRTDLDNDGDLCCPSSSVITLDACIRNFIQFTSCSIIEALEAVTLHPAVLLGIQERKGVIKPGADADLVFLDENLFVKRVFVAGEEVDLDGIDVQVTEKF